MSAWLADALLENSPARLKSRALHWTLSFAAHGILLATLLVVPLYRIDGIETHPWNYTQLVAASALGQRALVTPEMKRVAAARKLVAPKSIPSRVTASWQHPGETGTGTERAPLSGGGTVKAPRLVSLVEPVYPPLLRRAKVEGDVVIRAVIDTQGNVVDAHAVSGNDLLVPAAMDALRQWKYEPTLLDGQVLPVLLTVTISFRVGKKG